MSYSVELKGFEEFDKFVKNVDQGPQVFFYFSGSKMSDGSSWCPDCQESMPKKEHATKKKKPHVYNLNNYEEFSKFVDHMSVTGLAAYFLFTGQKQENGRSWCISCQLAEPVVKHFLSELKREIIFAYVDVGDRDYWKDRNCPFRTDNRVKLMVIPTIIKWGGVQRLEGSQCNKRDLLDMLLEEED